MTEPIFYWDYIGIGFVIGSTVALILMYFFLPYFFMQDCGCGVAIQAARNCIASHDWNSSVCGWLK